MARKYPRLVNVHYESPAVFRAVCRIRVDVSVSVMRPTPGVVGARSSPGVNLAGCCSHWLRDMSTCTVCIPAGIIVYVSVCPDRTETAFDDFGVYLKNFRRTANAFLDSVRTVVALSLGQVKKL